jgi:MFS family permease
MTSDYTKKFNNRFTEITRIYYGWVIVAVSTLIVFLAYGTMYSYSIFFKPIVKYFNWDRATVSSIYSISMVLRSTAAIGVGWLADRYGAMKITVLGGFMMGLGLILSGMATELWQFYLAYGLILSIGLSGTFTVSTTITSQWFIKKRALALAIVSTGSGMGTLFLVPLTERLIYIFNWSKVFIILGLTACILITSTAFLLKKPPLIKTSLHKPNEDVKSYKTTERSIKQAAFSKEMFMLIIIFSMLFFCVQMIMIHLVNHATDIGIDSLQAAGLISIIGVVSIPGRLIMGSASTRIGTHNSLIICIVLCMAALMWLFFCKSIMHFYIFAILFGFAYGGEVPLIPMFISQNFGLRIMATLMGILLFAANIIASFGPFLGGKIFDITSDYQYAFSIALGATVLALAMALVFKKTIPLTND